MTALNIEKITLNTFKATLARYPDVAPSALAELDTLRYDTVPAKLASIKGEKHLLKADVERLVEWKLYASPSMSSVPDFKAPCRMRRQLTHTRKHGTFRPTLMNLVKSNQADVIKSTTQSAFSSLDSNNDVLKALKHLTILRGIGPATASLLLSVYQPDAIPFFSDELFRWSCWGGVGAGSSGSTAGEGWRRKIKYNAKEYESILGKVRKLKERLGVGATEAEKVAYVLGMEQADVDGGVSKGKADDDVVEGKEAGRSDEKEAESRKEGIMNAIREAEALAKADGQDTTNGSNAKVAGDAPKKGTKRKAQEPKAPTEGTRRSTRRKV